MAINLKGGTRLEAGILGPKSNSMSGLVTSPNMPNKVRSHGEVQRKEVDNVTWTAQEGSASAHL
jgi:hypothetical protein